MLSSLSGLFVFECIAFSKPCGVSWCPAPACGLFCNFATGWFVFGAARACVLMLQGDVFVFIVGVSLVAARMPSKVSLFGFAVPCVARGDWFCWKTCFEPRRANFFWYIECALAAA